MKLSDCKPGVRVRVYKGDVQRVVSIKNTTLDGCVIVESDGIEFNEVFHPKQLRKIVPKKARPMFIVAIGDRGEIVDSCLYERATPAYLDDCKREDERWKFAKEIWAVKGFKKL